MVTLKRLILLALAGVGLLVLTGTAYAGTMSFSADWWAPTVSGADELMCELHVAQYDEYGDWDYNFNENIYMVPAADNCYVLGLLMPIATNTAVMCTYWSVGAVVTDEVELSADDYDLGYNGWEWGPGQYVSYANMWGYDGWRYASSATYAVTGSSTVAATVFDAVVERQLCASDSALVVTGSAGMRYATWKAETEVSDRWEGEGDGFYCLTDVSAGASATFWGPKRSGSRAG